MEDRAPARQPPTLRGSARLVPVGQTELYVGTTITLVGIELYADGFLADFRVAPVDGRLRDPRLVIACRDDRGGRYTAWEHRSNGDAGGSHRWLLSYSLNGGDTWPAERASSPTPVRHPLPRRGA